METRLPADFREFLRLLKAHEVRYLVVGGYAVAYHGYPRATQDLDVWVSTDRSNADRVSSTIKEFGFSPDLTAEQLISETDNVIRMGHPPMRIDILTAVTGVKFDQCYESRIVDTIDGVEVNLISLRDLKRNKQASGRHRDLDDLEKLP